MLSWGGRGAVCRPGMLSWKTRNCPGRLGCCLWRLGVVLGDWVLSWETGYCPGRLRCCPELNLKIHNASELSFHNA